MECSREPGFADEGKGALVSSHRSHHQFLNGFTLLASLMVILALSSWLAVPAAATGPKTIRVSVTSAGRQGNGDTGDNAVSDDGTIVAFDSDATNMVRGDTNDATDVFVRDRRTKETIRVSVSSRGAEGDDKSFTTDQGISGDGRFVTFDSDATNLVPGDTNGAVDVFVRDMLTEKTTRVSVSSSGQQGNFNSFLPGISGNGRFIAFSSKADNLVPHDTNNRLDVFVRDLRMGTTSRVSVSSAGQESHRYSFFFDGGISDDGRFVVFESPGKTLVPGDTNGKDDVFIRDLEAGTTTRVSLATSGAEGNDDSFTGVISGDGATVAFSSTATNLDPSVNDDRHKIDLFIHRLYGATTMAASISKAGRVGNKESCCSKMLSDDGRFVVFRSLAGNLVPDDTNQKLDVFYRDLAKDSTIRVSVSTTGMQASGDSSNAVVSSDGRWVVFVSDAPNLVRGDANAVFDTFERGPMF
jgi:Tol biopolymer transport system component